MIRGTAYHTVETTVKKGKKKEKSEIVKQENIPVKFEDLKRGDGAAQVERGRQLRLSLPYGAASITSTCEIRLTCDQDRATVKKAAKAAMKMVDSILEDDLDDMEKFINKAEAQQMSGGKA